MKQVVTGTVVFVILLFTFAYVHTHTALTQVSGVTTTICHLPNIYTHKPKHKATRCQPAITR